MMKKTILNISASLLTLALPLLLGSCSKQEIPSWGSTDYARIVGPSVWTLNTDSMEYSFASSPATVTSFTVEAEVWVEGANAEYDRTIYISIDDATNAPSSSYSLPPSVVIPAGEGRASLPIELKRVSELASSKYTLKVSIDDSRSDIQTGVSAWHSLTIKFSDILSKPKNWDDLSEFFGATYSDTKYRFIIDTLGFGEFTYLETNGMSWGEMWNYRLILVGALDEYNAAHPGNPLTDENGSIVSFDN